MRCSDGAGPRKVGKTTMTSTWNALFGRGRPKKGQTAVMTDQFDRLIEKDRKVAWPSRGVAFCCVAWVKFKHTFPVLVAIWTETYRTVYNMSEHSCQYTTHGAHYVMTRYHPILLLTTMSGNYEQLPDWVLRLVRGVISIGDRGIELKYWLRTLAQLISIIPIDGRVGCICGACLVQQAPDRIQVPVVHTIQHWKMSKWYRCAHIKFNPKHTATCSYSLGLRGSCSSANPSHIFATGIDSCRHGRPIDWDKISRISTHTYSNFIVKRSLATWFAIVSQYMLSQKPHHWPNKRPSLKGVFCAFEITKILNNA
jgi:hypothetical protein